MDLSRGILPHSDDRDVLLPPGRRHHPAGLRLRTARVSQRVLAVRRIGHQRRYLCGGSLLLSDLRLHGTVPRTVLPRRPVGVSALLGRACGGNARPLLPSRRRHRAGGVCGRHHPVLTAPWRHAMRPYGGRARLIAMPVR